MTTKQIINSTGYNLPTNWKTMKFKDKKHFVKTLKQTHLDSINRLKRFNNLLRGA